MLGGLRLASAVCLLFACICAASAERLLHPGIRSLLARGAAAARSVTVGGQRLPARAGASRLGRDEMPLDFLARPKVTSLHLHEWVRGLELAGGLSPFYDGRLDADLEGDEEAVEDFGRLTDLPVPASFAAAIKGTDLVSGDGAETVEARFAQYLGEKGAERTDAKLLLAVHTYVAGWAQEMNAALRRRDLKQCELYFPYLRLLFEACANVLPPVGEQTLYRGVDADVAHEYAVDSTVTWLSVISCSRCNFIAECFLSRVPRPGVRGTLFAIEALNAYDLSGTSAMSWEKESILLPGTRLTVLRVEALKHYNVVQLREVDRAFPLARRDPSRLMV